jgi:hypothetical protein
MLIMRDGEKKVITASNMFYNKKNTIPVAEKVRLKGHAKDNTTAGSQIVHFWVLGFWLSGWVGLGLHYRVPTHSSSGLPLPLPPAGASHRSRRSVARSARHWHSQWPPPLISSHQKKKGNTHRLCITFRPACRLPAGRGIRLQASALPAARRAAASQATQQANLPALPSRWLPAPRAACRPIAGLPHPPSCHLRSLSIHLVF